MQYDGPILVSCRDCDDAVVADLVAHCGLGVLPVTPEELPALIDSADPAAVVVLDEPQDRAAADALTAAVLARDIYVPLVRRWSPEAMEADRPATLWLAADAGGERIRQALQRAVRIRMLLLEARRRQQVLAEAATAKSALAPPALPDPWGSAREASVLVLDTGLALPRIAPTCAARGLSIVGAPTVSVAGNYLELRSFDAVVVGPGIAEEAAGEFLAWLRDDPRWRDLPVLRLTAAVAAAPERLDEATEAMTLFDPRLPATLFAVARLHALVSALSGAMTSMDTTGLADPETGLLWPEAFRASLAQALGWAAQSGTELMLLRIAPGAGGVPLPAGAARLAARLLRRSDLVTRFDHGTVLAVLVGADHAIAERVVDRVAGVLAHTALATGTAPADVDVRCHRAQPDDTAAGLIARLAEPAGPAPVRLAG